MPHTLRAIVSLTSVSAVEQIISERNYYARFGTAETDCKILQVIYGIVASLHGARTASSKRSFIIYLQACGWRASNSMNVYLVIKK